MHDIGAIRSSVRSRRPLIHCITNPISIHACANAILAVGARPIMAEHPAEAAEITQTADALVLNLGNITDARMQSMEISLRVACEKEIPVLVDAVGVACSKLRRDYLMTLLETGTPTVIKGNYSEIRALHQAGYRAPGVDAEDISAESLCRMAMELARARKTVILASGKTDIVTDGTRLMRIENGTPQLATVTGTGCMLGALCGAYLSACPQMDAAATACVVLGVCGQRAETPLGSGSFMVRLMDELSTISQETLKNDMNLEESTYA